VIIYSKNFFDFVKSSIFYAPLKYGKSYWNRRHFGSRPCFQESRVWWLLWCHFENMTICISRPLRTAYLFMFGRLDRYWSQIAEICRIDVIVRCSNVRSSENGIALHTIPFYGNEHLEAKKRRKRWIDFVRQKRAGWDPSKSSVICSKNFKANDFVRNYALITDKQAQSIPYLVRDCFGFTAYPTVHVGELEAEQHLSDRDKRMTRFLGFVRALRWPSFLLGIFLTILHQPMAHQHKQYSSSLELLKVFSDRRDTRNECPSSPSSYPASKCV